MLLLLFMEPAATTPRLAERLALPPGTVRAALSKLEDRKLVSEHAATGDARKREHGLTPEGRRVVHDLLARSRRLLDEWDQRGD